MQDILKKSFLNTCRMIIWINDDGAAAIEELDENDEVAIREIEREG